MLEKLRNDTIGPFSRMGPHHPPACSPGLTPPMNPPKAAPASPGLSARPAYQKYAVQVRQSVIDGQGAFAAEPVAARRKIGEIRGESISVGEARILSLIHI